MNSTEQIIAKQAEWANNKGLELIGAAQGQASKMISSWGDGG